MRPADLLLKNLDVSPIALDVSIIHGVSSELLIKEARKIADSEGLCSVAGFTFHPFVVSTYGEFGPCAVDLCNLLTHQMAAPRPGEYDRIKANDF